jgi:F-type H+-transporting ATPase subunit b
MKTLFIAIVLAISMTTGLAGASQEGGHGAFHLWPFVFQVVNFILLLLVLYKFAGPGVRSFFAARSQTIRQSLKEAEDAKAEAERKLREHEAKLKALDKEVEELRAVVENEGRSERDRIIAQAEKEAETIKEQAKIIAQQEIKRAKKELRKEAARLSLQRAEDMVKDAINDEDQARLRNDYISQITQ